MKSTVRRSIGTLAALCAVTAQANGLQVDPDTVVWPRWQARLGVTTAPLDAPGQGPRGTALDNAGLLGDYYFSGPGFGQGRVTGGFRATSGLFTGGRASALSTPLLPARDGSAFTLTTRSRMATDGGGDVASAIPYLGIGYTGMSLRGGWGFSADVGLVGSGVRLGRPVAGNQVDELLQELRLTPMLQLGVSYSF
jgi:hypothetical protein